MKIIYIALALIVSANIFAQDSVLTKKNDEWPYNPHKGYPKYLLYLGFGVIPGERVGVLVQPHEKFSIDVSYGYVFGTGWSQTDLEYRANVGANYHFSKDVPVILGLQYTTAIRPAPSSTKDRHYISLNAGYLNLEEKGWHFIGNVGFFMLLMMIEEEQGYLGFLILI